MKKNILLLWLMIVVSLSVQAQTPAYQVYIVRFAQSTTPFTVADWAHNGPKDEKQPLDFMVWLITGKNKIILFDTGFLGDVKYAKRFALKGYIRPDSALLKLGVKPDDVTDVILSHPHWDHIGGIGLFPKAHIWIQQDDFNGFMADAWKKGKANALDDRIIKIMTTQYLAGKVTLVDGDNHEILPGITAFTGSRHTYNSKYLLVNTGSNKVVLASDNIWVYYSLDHLVPPADGGTLDTAGYVKAMIRMKTMVSDPKFIIPGHDSRVLTKFPVVADGVVEVK